MFRFLFPFLFSFLALGTVSLAEEFTLEAAVSHALKNNLELAAARLKITEARGRLLQSGRLSNPEFESEFQPNIRGREFSLGAGFVQRFPLTNRLRLEKSISQAEVAAAQAEVTAAELKLATAVRSVGVKLLSLQASLELKERQIANSKELAESAAKTAARGEGSSLEASQFELEAEQLSLDLLQLESERVVLEGETRPLLGLPSETTVRLTGTLPEPIVPASALTNISARPDYQAALARVRAARRGVALAKANKWEDVSVGLSAGLERAEDAPEGLENEGIIGLKFSMPVPFWNKNEGRIKEAVAAAVRAEREAQALASGIRTEAATALEEMKVALRILRDTTARLLPKAREIEEQVSNYYRQAQPGTQLSDVLRSREKRLSLEQAKLDALRSFHLARVRFNAATGH